MKKNDIKTFLAGLAAGSVVAGAGVYLSDPKNREKVNKNLENFKEKAETMLEDIKAATKEATESGDDEFLEELKEAQSAIEKSLEKLNK